MAKHRWTALGAVVAAVGLMAYLASVDLEEADQLASVMSLFVGLAGLGLSVYALRETRASRQQHPQTPPSAEAADTSTPPGQPTPATPAVSAEPATAPTATAEPAPEPTVTAEPATEPTVTAAPVAEPADAARQGTPSRLCGAAFRLGILRAVPRPGRDERLETIVRGLLSIPVVAFFGYFVVVIWQSLPEQTADGSDIDLYPLVLRTVQDGRSRSSLVKAAAAAEHPDRAHRRGTQPHPDERHQTPRRAPEGNAEHDVFLG